VKKNKDKRGEIKTRRRRHGKQRAVFKGSPPPIEKSILLEPRGKLVVEQEDGKDISVKSEKVKDPSHFEAGYKGRYAL